MQKIRTDATTCYILVFKSTHTALKAESLLKEDEIEFRLIPTPGRLVAGCGLSIRFTGKVKPLVLDLLDKKGVEYDCYLKTNTGYETATPNTNPS